MSTPADNRFAPPKSHVADVVETESVELASLGSRLGASLLNSLFACVPFIPGFVKMLPGLVQSTRNATGMEAVAQAMASAGIWFALGTAVELVICVVQIVYLYKYSQSIGKRIVGIKIVRTDGSPASFSRVFWLRIIVNWIISVGCSLIPLIGRFYGLIDVLFIFGNARRCVHDYLADTIVVKA